jgi:hypothetical protein
MIHCLVEHSSVPWPLLPVRRPPVVRWGVAMNRLAVRNPPATVRFQPVVAAGRWSWAAPTDCRRRTRPRPCCNPAWDPLDAVIAGVNIVERDPDDHSVGYGGLPNEDGVVELDSCVMHGPTHNAGAVAALRNIKTPSRVARLVMERTDHVLLVGGGGAALRPGTWV